MKTTKARFCLAAVVFAVAFSSPARAAEFDFATLALGNEGPFSTWTVDGITVVATSQPPGSDPYLDDLFEGRPAGLGVCQNVEDDGECNPSSDDNVTSGESLTLMFFDAAMHPIQVLLDFATFRDELHHPVFPAGSLIDIQVDGGGFLSLALEHQVNLGWIGHSFDFRFNNEQFYIETLTVSRVAEPGVLFLLGSALLGFLGWARPRRG